MRRSRTALGLASLLTCLAATMSAHAICETVGIISSVFPVDSGSYVATPGIEPVPDGSSVGPTVAGVFWAVGSGNPALDQGHDSGAFAGADWIQRPDGYPATFDTTWAANPAIDGCIRTTGDATCTAVLLSDQSAGRGYFAFLTAAPLHGDFSFVQPDNGPIALAAIPQLELSGVTAFPGVVRGTVSVEPPAAGLYPGGQCPSGLLAGYRIYGQVVAHGAVAPADLRRSAGSWSVAEGGQTATGEPLASGASSEVTVACGPNTDVYFAVSLVFDSGFETAHVSQPLPPIHCP